MSLAALVSPSLPSLASCENVPLRPPQSPFPSRLSPNSSSLHPGPQPLQLGHVPPPPLLLLCLFGITCTPDPQPHCPSLCLTGTAASPAMGTDQLLASQSSWVPKSLLLGNNIPPPLPELEARSRHCLLPFVLRSPHPSSCPSLGLLPWEGSPSAGLLMNA